MRSPDPRVERRPESKAGVSATDKRLSEEELRSVHRRAGRSGDVVFKHVTASTNQDAKKVTKGKSGSGKVHDKVAPQFKESIHSHIKRVAEQRRRRGQ